jgi:ribonuclease J
MINQLIKKGAEVFYRDIMSDLHVSGHANREELKIMLALTQPRFFIPIHASRGT